MAKPKAFVIDSDLLRREIVDVLTTYTADDWHLGQERVVVGTTGQLADIIMSRISGTEEEPAVHSYDTTNNRATVSVRWPDGEVVEYDRHECGLECNSDLSPDEDDVTLRSFHENQWWVTELDAMAAHLGATADQKRSVAIVHRLLQKIAHDPRLSEETPIIYVNFECENNDIVGTTSAKVKRVGRNEDNSLTAVIDHWPR